MCQRVSCKTLVTTPGHHKSVIRLGLTFSFMTVPSFREHTLHLAMTEVNRRERRGPRSAIRPTQELLLSDSERRVWEEWYGGGEQPLRASLQYEKLG